MKLFKRVLSFLLATIMVVPSGLTIAGATEAETNNGAYTVTLLETSNGTMAFTDKSKNASTASQNGYQLMTVDEEGNLVKVENDGSVWAFSAGDTVEVVLTADNGYNVKSFGIKDESGNVLASKETTDNMFSFTMPGKNITIESVFISQDATNIDVVPDKIFGQTEYHDVTESDEMTRKEINETELDLVVESYIKSNIDTKYTRIDKVELANILYIKNTFVDGSTITPEDTIDSVMGPIENGGLEDENFDVFDKFIGQTDSISPLYNFSDDSEYYVAYANTLIKDNQYKVQDFVFAIQDNNGKVVSGCIYDSKTGLAYIPKSLFLDTSEEFKDQNLELLLHIQVQFMQVLKSNSSDEIDVISSVYVSDIDEKNRSVQIEKVSHNPFSLETVVNVERGMEENSFDVIINGVLAGSETYRYNAENGELTIYLSSASIISVSIEKKQENEILSALAQKTEAYAEDWSPNIIIPAPSEVPPLGTHIKGKMDVYYNGSNQTNHNGVYHTGKSDATNDALWTGTVKGNYELTTSAVIQGGIKYWPFTVDFNTYDGLYPSAFKPIDKVTLSCTHVNNPNILDYNFKIGTVRHIPFALKVVEVGDTSTGDATYICDDCGTTFDSVDAANAHIGAGGDNKGYKCKTCGYTTQDVLQKQMHENTAFTINEYECMTCGDKFKNEINDDGTIDYDAEVLAKQHITDNPGHNLYEPIKIPHNEWEEVEVSATPCHSWHGGEKTSGYMVISLATCSFGGQCGTGLIKVAWNEDKQASNVTETVPPTDPLCLYLFKLPFDEQYTLLKDKYEMPINPTNNASLAGAKYQVMFWPYVYTSLDEALNNDDEIAPAVWVFQTKEKEYNGGKYGFVDFEPILSGNIGGEHASANPYLIQDSIEMPYANFWGQTGTYWITEESASNGFREEGGMADFTGMNVSFDELMNSQANLKDGLGYTNAIAKDEIGLLYVMQQGDEGTEVSIAKNGELLPCDPLNIAVINANYPDGVNEDGFAIYNAEKIYHPEVDSYATWDDTQKKFIYPHNDLIATDTIQVSEMRPNTRYQVITKLKDLDTGEYLISMDGGNYYENEIYNSLDHGSAELVVRFRIDTSVLTQTPDALAGHTLVFVNEVYMYDENDELDPNGVVTLDSIEAEMLKLSKSGTELLDKNTGKHITHAIQGRVVYDTIIYENLEPEREYTVKAWLMDKDTNNYAVDAYGTPIVIAQNTVKQISSATGSGEWQIEYAFDAHFYEVNRLNMVQDWLQPGRTYVSFVEVYQGDELVLEYKDIDDENETIVIPRIRTELLDDKTGDHISFAGGGIVNLTDTITYDHMLPGETYRVHTTMIDMDTGDVAIDANGNPIEFDTTVSTTGSEGEWKIPISFDASNLEGHVLVCYEEVFIDSAGVDQPDAEIAHHTDYFDRKQRMYFPYIDTYANDVKTGALIRGETNANANHNAFAEDEMVIQDLVRYEAAMPVVTYTMVSELHYALDTPDGKHKKGDIVVDDNGKVMHMRTVWFADAMDPEDEQWYFDGWIQPNDEDRDEENPGQGRILFQFDGDSHAGYTYVIKEWMYYGEFPMNGEITEDMIQESSDKPYVSQGLNHNMIVEDHLELDDKDQMIWVPDLKTKAYDSETGIQISKADKYSKIFDDIELWNLIPGLTYRLRGTVMDRSYGSENDQTPQAFIDADGKEVTATFEFTPQITDPNDKWYLDIDEFGRTHMLLSRGEMVFTIDASDIYQETTDNEIDQNKDREEIVIFERLYQIDRNKADDDEMIIAQHVDINDLDQRIVYPRIVTDAMEHKTGTHIALAEGNCSDPVNGFCGGNSQYPLHIIDRVTYHNLLVGYEYSLTATIRNLATGEAIAINDPSKTSQTVTFVAEPPAPGAVKPGQTTTGSVEVNFWLDGKILEGGTYVIYEELFYNGVSIAEHKDENDENQKFYVPRIVTNAKNEETNNRLIYPGETTTITDTVTLTGLIPGRTYTIEGVIKDKDTRSNLYVNNKTVTSKVSIHPDQIDDNGRVTVPVSYTMTSEDTERLAGKTLVVFERVYLESSDRRVMVAMHENFDDPLQTLTTVRAGTDMIDALTLDKLSFAEGHVVFKDSVFYENLIPGRNYSVKGYLVDRDLSLKNNAVVKFRDAHNMHVTVDTQEIADRKTGTGSWEVIYEFDGKDLEGKTLVAYTTITDLTTNEVYYSTELIDKRENKLLGLQDQSETIHFPKIRTLEADIKMSPNSSHFTLAEAECTVTDTVSYENLIAGRWYVMKGQIIDKFSGKPAKDDNGYPITSTYRFRPREASGAVELEYNFDGKLLEGNSYVLYESLYMDGSDVIIAKHEDMEDENQTFYIPKVSTQAWDEYTEMQISVADSVTTIHDKVKLEGLQIGESYTVRGVLMDTDAISATCDQCGETFSNVALVEKHISENRACVSYTAEYTELIPITGSPVTAEYTIPRTESRESMEVELTFDIDTRGLNGKTFVVYEELYHGEDLIGEHRDIADQKQTIYVPTIHTSVVDSVTHQHISKADEEVRLTDTVTYENLEPNRSYVVEGVLMDKSINLPFTDAQGNRITGRTEFIPTSSSGTVNVEFVFNASDLQGKTLVVYETLYAVKPKVGLALIAKHEDINDENQTIHIPKVWSEAYNTDSGNELTKIDKYAKVVDKVFYENLVPGLTYTVEGTIFDLTNQRMLKDNRGRDIVFTKTFTPTTANSFVEVEYLINTTKMGNRTYVLYSDIFYDGNSIGEHKDPNDVKEMFAVPRIGTQAIAGDIPEQMTFADNVATIVDTIAYENLTIDREYIVKGILMDKATGKPLLDVHGNQITAQAVLVPETKNGTIEMTFEFDATGFEGKTAVVFESIYFGEAIIAEHEDIEDESQSIHFPRIWSLAQGNETGMTHVGPADSIMTITDRVYFENLIADEAYHIAGTIYDVETGEPAINADGDIVTAQATLNPHGVTSGYQDVVFTFDATGMRGKTLVIFEELYYHKDEFQDYKVAIHNEIDDVEQMIHIPEIGTTAVDSETLDHISKADDTVTIIDTVAYTNLVPDLVYTLRGILMDKETGEEILDDFGLTVEAMRTFTPTDWDGTVDLTFHDVSMETLAGKTVVVFEYLYYGDTLIEHHDDIEDEEQTIHLPKLQTSAFDFDSQSHNSMSKDHVQIVDEVTYFNLIPGKEYVVKGIMMNKDTGMPVIDADGKQVTGETTFTPETPDGTVDVIFEMNATGMDPASMVVFEELFLNDVSIGEHSDLEDEDQSMYVPWIGTVIVDDDVELQMSFADEEITITDTVKFKNLVVGTHYELIGKLMDKATGKPVLDDNGEEVIGITEFTANVTQGHEFVTFTFSGVNLEGCTLVAYENLYVVRDDEELSIVASHEDINDVDQTIYIPRARTEIVDNETKINYTMADNQVSLTDTISYENLMVGYTYVASGVLVDRETGEPIVDVNGQEIRAEQTFTPTNTMGTVDIVFEFDATGFEGKTFNAFEEITVNGKLVARHADLTDEKQDIHFPDIHTMIRDNKTEINISNADKYAQIIDTVYYENLKVGEEYIVSGMLINKATGKPVSRIEDLNLDDIIETWTCDQCGEGFASREEVLAHFDASPDEECYSYTLVVDYEDPTPYVATAKFVAQSARGTVDVVFEFDTTHLEGTTLVAYETLTWNDIVMSEHKDIEDEAQTIYIPKIGTHAVDGETSLNIVNADESVKIVDTVTYTNLIPGTEYILTGKLMNKDTDEFVKDSEGNVITAERVFTPEESDGEVEVIFTFDGITLENTTLVVFEQLALNTETKPVVAEHEDIEDEAQTIYIPKVETLASEKTTNMNLIKVSDEMATIVDRVETFNLIVGKTYTLNGVLMSKQTGEAVLDSNGNEVTATKTFVAQESRGFVDVEFTFPTKELAGNTLVVFEELLVEGFVVAEHEDINDEDQTVYVPDIGTTAVDSETGDHIANGDETVTIIDTVEYRSLIPGKTYTMSGTLMDKKTGKPITDAEGNVITAEKEFVAEKSDGSIELTFTFDGALLKGTTVVAFEKCYYEGVEVAVHEDINDENQSVDIPDIGTTAVDEETQTHHARPSGETTVIDMVQYTNLTVGKEYTVSGTLMVKGTGKELVDATGKPVTATTTFVAEQKNGSVELRFTFDSSLLEGESVVAFEDLLYNGKVVASHKDINDEDQTVHFAKIGTTAVDGNTKEHMGAAGATTIVDTVAYENLIPGTSYTISGVLMDKETGKEYVTSDDEDAKPYTATVTFVPTEPNGTVELTFNVNAIAGKTIVVFEKAYITGTDKVVAEHEDINDEAQSVGYPEIRTHAYDKDTASNVVSHKKEATVIDTVTYKGLIIGKTYTINGELVDKATGTPTGIKASKTFVAETSNGSVELVFTFDSTRLAGKTLVAFEKLIHEGVEVTNHTDLNDEEQTVYIPDIRTTATDKATDTKTVSYGTDVVITDAVLYTNLVPGKEYEMSGQLVDKSTGKSIGATASQKFTPDKPNGSVVLEFTIDSTKLVGKTLVAFETLTYKGIEVGVHTDLNDEAQTVYVPEIGTMATVGNGLKETYPGKNTEITDTVSYKNLTPGVEYTLVGTLMDKATGKILSMNGKKLTASTTFTPVAPNGTVTMTFTFDSTACAEREIVVFERLSIKGTLVAVHEDINDENQTVKFTDKPSIPDNPSNPNTPSNPNRPNNPSNTPNRPTPSGGVTQTGDNYTTIAIAMSIAIVALGVAIILFKKKKNDE